MIDDALLYRPERYATVYGILNCVSTKIIRVKYHGRRFSSSMLRIRWVTILAIRLKRERGFKVSGLTLLQAFSRLPAV